ncbi:tRNA 2-thiouridine(34) synthase MnmA [bacterium]|nr:MAG: tRNA 2-thiouridine(34) synthase MnmA [bacterium]
MKERIVVAMSGGVDSAVAAALLKKKGYEVIGLTMCFNLPDSKSKRPNCCSAQGIEDARRVAYKLDIKHYVLNMQKDLSKIVIQDFCREYLAGRTPNPCVRCNQYLKFGTLLEKAISLDARFLATGHYCRIVKAGAGYKLKKAKDLKKDQSYFLYRLNQRQLGYTIFPLGGYTKDAVRKMARKFGLTIADKLASQEICFIPGMDYRKFLKEQKNLFIKPGLVINKSGQVLGRHKGIAFYTIGQREGLGIAMGHPVYITKLDPEKNLITLGSKEEAFFREFLVKEPHFILKIYKKKFAARVKIRYNHKEAPAELMPEGDKIRIRFKKPQFAITAGQSAVFYDTSNQVLGGGIIERVLN